MDQAQGDHIQHELEIAADELFAGWIRRVELVHHDDAPWMEPDQLMPRLVFKNPADRVRDPHPDPRKVAKAARTFKMVLAATLSAHRSAAFGVYVLAALDGDDGAGCRVQAVPLPG